MSPAPCPGLRSGPGILGYLGPLPPPPQAQNRTSRTQNLIQTLVAGVAPTTRSRTAPQALVLDGLCLILDILAPKLRPVSASSEWGWGCWWGQALATLSIPAHR